ncbi:hypothetical protein EJ08DRAFT_652136 [Tothia fuscella]|uniref:Uncharacterized protein n=1 Tax=Tothia fuscella TaxID=1048955 RepID=A0A9P4NKM9_9PEZI|nr:hypothetical protein EJ08DRAFT_652136 [Tothia fuscella]
MNIIFRTLTLLLVAFKFVLCAPLDEDTSPFGTNINTHQPNDTTLKALYPRRAGPCVKLCTDSDLRGICQTFCKGPGTPKGSISYNNCFFVNSGYEVSSIEFTDSKKAGDMHCFLYRSNDRCDLNMTRKDSDWTLIRSCVMNFKGLKRKNPNENWNDVVKSVDCYWDWD